MFFFFSHSLSLCCLRVGFSRHHHVAAATVRAPGVRLELHDAHAVRVGRTEESARGHRRPDATVDQHPDGRQGGQLGCSQGRTSPSVSIHPGVLISSGGVTRVLRDACLMVICGWVQQVARCTPIGIEKCIGNLALPMYIKV